MRGLAHTPPSGTAQAGRGKNSCLSHPLEQTLQIDGAYPRTSSFHAGRPFEREQLGSIDLQLARLSDASFASAATPADERAVFRFVLGGSALAVLGGNPPAVVSLGRGALLTGAHPGDRLEHVSDDLHELRVTVPRPLLRAALETHLQRIVPDLVFDRTGTFVAGRAAHAFDQVWSAFTYRARERRTGEVDLVWRRVHERTVLAALVLGLAHDQARLIDRPAASLDPGSVRRALQFVEANLTRVVTLEELAAAARCSPRSLQTAFKVARGLSPMQYLERRRLAVARQRILRCDGSTIAAISRDLGYSSPGRFAIRFKARYGISPASLVRECPGSPVEQATQHPPS